MIEKQAALAELNKLYFPFGFSPNQAQAKRSYQKQKFG